MIRLVCDCKERIRIHLHSSSSHRLFFFILYLYIYFFLPPTSSFLFLSFVGRLSLAVRGRKRGRHDANDVVTGWIIPSYSSYLPMTDPHDDRNRPETGRVLKKKDDRHPALLKYIQTPNDQRRHSVQLWPHWQRPVIGKGEAQRQTPPDRQKKKGRWLGFLTQGGLV